MKVLSQSATNPSHDKEEQSSCNTSKELGDKLEEKVMELFNEANTLPLSMSEKRGNIVVRTKWEGSNMVTLGEAKRVKKHPKDYQTFLENFNEAFPKVNPMSKKILHLEYDDDREGLKSILNFPFPLTNRIMVDWKYLKLNRNEDEHLLIISAEENVKLIRKYVTTEETKKYVLGHTYLLAYWIQPVRDVNDEVIGSSIKYVFSGNTGGSVPQWVQNAVGPKTALDSVKKLADYVEKKGNKRA